jgi:uncharacterized protein YbaR (Trm112 family)
VTDALATLLACPVTRTRLRWEQETNRLVSDEAKLAYPIREGVPVLLAEEAVPVGSAADS